MLCYFLCFCFSAENPKPTLRVRKEVNFEIIAQKDIVGHADNNDSGTIVSQRTSRRSVRSSVVTSDWELYRQAVLSKDTEIREYIVRFVGEDANYAPAEAYSIFSASLLKLSEQLDDFLPSLQELKKEFERISLQQNQVDKRGFFERLMRPGPDQLKGKKEKVVQDARSKRDELSVILSANYSQTVEMVSFPPKLLDFLASDKYEAEDIDEDSVVGYIRTINDTVHVINGILTPIRSNWPEYYASKASLQKTMNKINLALRDMALEPLENKLSLCFIKHCPDPIEKIVVEAPEEVSPIKNRKREYKNGAPDSLISVSPVKE